MTTMTHNETSPDQAVEAVALDGCQFCLGQKGGVPGNENRLGSIAVCDYCYILTRDAGLTIPTPPPDHTDLMARLVEIIIELANDAEFCVPRQWHEFTEPADPSAMEWARNLAEQIAERLPADALQAHASPREWQFGKADRNNALLLASICQKVRHSSASVAERDDALRDAAEMLRVIARTALGLG